MAKIYYNLIKAGLKTIDDVPSVWRKAVQTSIDADNKNIVEG